MSKDIKTDNVVVANFQQPAQPLPKGLRVVAGGEWMEAQREEIPTSKPEPTVGAAGSLSDPQMRERKRLMANGYL